MTLTTQNKSRATGDVRTALLVIGFLLFCIVGWVISWRTAQSWFVYFLTPILILVIAISVVPLLASGIMMGGKASRWAFLGLAIMVLYGSKMLWSSWPEIHWGAPKLLAVTGSVLSFEEGQQHKLPLRDLTVQGEETLRKKIGRRLTLQGMQNAALGVLFDGQAKAGEESMKFAEEDARENGYGVWGGGSYERDLETLEKLRTRLGDDAIHDAVSPSE